jgi:FKBP-type peptidyl-prolyl cis-trans isomerase FklB
MKNNILVVSLFVTFLLVWTCTAQDESPIEDKQSAIGYSTGVIVATELKFQEEPIDIEAIVKGFRDGLESEGKSADDHVITMKEVGEQFLKANANADGVVVLESGLQYKVLKEGSGKIPAETDHIKTHYRGALLDGSEIDNTYKDDRPADIGIYQVFPGWKEALQKMPIGSKWRVFIPSDLAYGEKGAGKKIPPHSVLIFEIETLEIITQHLQDFR